MATNSSTLAWKIPWTEKPGRLQSMASQRVGHDWTTSLSLFTVMHWRRKWQPTPVFLPGESQGRGAWWAAVYGVAQSWTRLTWLSSTSNISSGKCSALSLYMTMESRNLSKQSISFYFPVICQYASSLFLPRRLVMFMWVEISQVLHNNCSFLLSVSTFSGLSKSDCCWEWFSFLQGDDCS